MENRHIFNDLKLPIELNYIIFGFFSAANLRNTSLVNKEFLSLTLERKNQLVNYFSNIKLYLDITRDGLAALFSLKTVDLNDEVTGSEADKLFESNDLSGLSNLIGVNQEELIANLNAFIDSKFEVASIPPSGIFPEISIVARKKEEEDVDFKISSLALIQKFQALGIEVVLSEDLEEVLKVQLNKPS